MNRLKIVSQFRNEYIFLAIGLLLFILLQTSVIIYALLVLYGIYLYKTNSKILVCLVVVIAIYFLRTEMVNHSPALDNKTVIMTVKSSTKYQNFTIVSAKINKDSYRLSIAEEVDMKPGQQYEVHIIEENNQTDDIPFTFDIETYDQANQIKGRYRITSYTYIQKVFHVGQILERIHHYIDESMPNSGGYVKTMVLADNTDLDEDLLSQVQFLGISHLFAVSGLHIGLMVFMVKKVLDKLFHHEYYANIVLVIFLLCYIVLTSFTPSVVRASLMVILVLVNKYGSFELDALDLVSIIFIGLLIVHPFYYLQLGFQLSFLMTFVILLGQNLLKDKNKVEGVFSLSCLAFFASLPFVLQMNQSANIMSIFYNGVYLVLVMFGLLPLAYVTFIFPMFDGLYSIFISVFEQSVELLANIDMFVINMIMNHVVIIIIYYVLLISILIMIEYKKIYPTFLYASGIFIIYLIFQGSFVIYDSIHFLNVYGDATIVQSSFNRCNILIDTGAMDDYDSLITYMKNKHIKRIDYFIISHPHSDHEGEKYDVLEAFDVVHYIDQSNVEQYTGITKCGSAQFVFYPMERNNENVNNNSIIMSLFIEQRHYLFTGDIEYQVEELFVTRHIVKSVDYIKVPHHGSITSSSNIFLDTIKPANAVFMVSVKNTHDHPNEEVVLRYKKRQINVLRTDQLGTIEIRYLFGKEWKKTSK